VLPAPAGTPKPIIQKRYREVNKALGMADVRQWLDQLGLEIGGGATDEFVAFIRTESERLTTLIKAGTVSQEYRRRQGFVGNGHPPFCCDAT